jgi:hypothetical protein
MQVGKYKCDDIGKVLVASSKMGLLSWDHEQDIQYISTWFSTRQATKVQKPPLIIIDIMVQNERSNKKNDIKLDGLSKLFVSSN